VQYQLTHSCIVLVLLCLIKYIYIFGFDGINIKSQHVAKKKVFYVYVCVCVYVCVVCVCVVVWCVCLCVSIYLCVGMHYKIKSICERNDGNIDSNISVYISPIRLRYIPSILDGARVRVSGWGRTSDSKYSFLIILQFNLENCTYQNDCFKGEVTHGLQKSLWSMKITSIYTVACRV